MKKIFLTVLAGLIVALIVGLVRMYFFKDKTPVSPTAKTRIENIDVRQEGKRLTDTTGVDLSPCSNDMEVGKVQIEQKADFMRNVTGVKIHGVTNSGTMELKDKMTARRKTPKGEDKVEFNTDIPGNEVKFFGKSKNDGD